MLNTFYDKFIFTNQLKFKDYNFFLVNIPFTIVPVDLLIDLGEQDNPEIGKAFYYSFKHSMGEHLLPKFGITFGSTAPGDALQFAQQFFTASGWGLMRNVEVDYDHCRAIVVLSSSPLAAQLKGKVNHPVDHFTRGIIAGIFSKIFRKDVDCVEKDCLASGATDCTFIIKPLNEFDFSKEETIRQLNIKL